jgi:hypothetical protein
MKVWSRSRAEPCSAITARPPRGAAAEKPSDSAMGNARKSAPSSGDP